MDGTDPRYEHTPGQPLQQPHTPGAPLPHRHGPVSAAEVNNQHGQHEQHAPEQSTLGPLLFGEQVHVEFQQTERMTTTVLTTLSPEPAVQSLLAAAFAAVVGNNRDVEMDEAPLAAQPITMEFKQPEGPQGMTSEPGTDQGPAEGRTTSTPTSQLSTHEMGGEEGGTVKVDQPPGVAVTGGEGADAALLQPSPLDVVRWSLLPIQLMRPGQQGAVCPTEAEAELSRPEMESTIVSNRAHTAWEAVVQQLQHVLVEEEEDMEGDGLEIGGEETDEAWEGLLTAMGELQRAQKDASNVCQAHELGTAKAQLQQMFEDAEAEAELHKQQQQGVVTSLERLQTELEDRFLRCTALQEEWGAMLSKELNAYDKLRAQLPSTTKAKDQMMDRLRASKYAQLKDLEAFATNEVTKAAQKVQKLGQSKCRSALNALERMAEHAMEVSDEE